MLHKELKSPDKIVQVFKCKATQQNGFDYYIHVLTKGAFNTWQLNESYKQKLSITSEENALKIAQTFLTDEL